MRHIVIAAVMLGLTACSGNEDKTQEAAADPAAPALQPGRDAIYAAARGEPEPFVRAVYAALSADAMGPDLTPGQDPIYSRMMNARIGADSMRAGGGRVLNWEPLCDCDDGQGVSLNSVAISPGEKPTEAQAAVNITKGEDAETLTLKLLKEGPMWRVEDVMTDGDQPLSERVMKGIS